MVRSPRYLAVPVVVRVRVCIQFAHAPMCDCGAGIGFSRWEFLAHGLKHLLYALRALEDVFGDGGGVGPVVFDVDAEDGAFGGAADAAVAGCLDGEGHLFFLSI